MSATIMLAAKHQEQQAPRRVVDGDEQVRMLMLLEQVATLANRSSNPAPLLKIIVALVCNHFGFVGGNALICEGGDGEVVLRGCGAAYAADEDGGRDFIEASNRFSIWACAALPGRLLLDPVASYLTNLPKTGNFSRYRETRDLGARAMIAVPILVDDTVVGAFEFFVDEADPADGRRLDLLCHIGGEVAPVFRRAQLESQLRIDAVIDATTGLPNRAMFEARLNEMFADAISENRPGPTLMVVEFEGIKQVRDTSGFLASNLLLVEIASRIAHLIKEFGAADRQLLHYAHTIMFARMGGNDFAISIDGPDRETLALEIADAIHYNLRSLDCNLRATAHISASIGIAHDNRSYACADEILRDADFAMYHAQARGTDHSFVFDQDMRAANQATAGLVFELQDAIRHQQFILHYQPIYLLGGQQVVGVEALVRWRRRDGSLTMPNEFIAVAESHGLIAEIGNQVLREACRMMARLQSVADPGRRPYVSVNLSTYQLLQPDFLERVREILDETAIDPKQLAVEITESAAVIDLEQSVRMLTQLRAWGIKVGLDDFGTGYSSLSHLQDMPLDGIKIDRSFVMHQTDTSANWSIVTAILQMAKALRLRVIAEGIETEFQLNSLRALGCGLGQGNYVSLPVDEATINAMLTGKRKRRQKVRS